MLWNQRIQYESLRVAFELVEAGWCGLGRGKAVGRHAWTNMEDRESVSGVTGKAEDRDVRPGPSIFWS